MPMADLQARCEHAERVALRQQRQQPMQGAQQGRVLARLQQLQAQEGEGRGVQQLHQAVHL